jgi:transcriptional regulator with XRE-family HTH domain
MVNEMASTRSALRDTREEIDFEEIKARSPEIREAFENASFALEASRLVREMRAKADGGAGIKPGELAKRLRVSKARVSAIEKGEGPSGPTYATLKRIAAACNVDLLVGLQPRK